MLAGELPTRNQLAILIGIFEDRCLVLAARARAGQLPFLDAVDMAQSAAEWAGLVEIIGCDQVQAVLRSAFMNIPRETAA